MVYGVPNLTRGAQNVIILRPHGALKMLKFGGPGGPKKGVPILIYSIAGNFRWVQIFAMFADRLAYAKIKTAKK